MQNRQVCCVFSCAVCTVECRALMPLITSTSQANSFSHLDAVLNISSNTNGAYLDSNSELSLSSQAPSAGLSIPGWDTDYTSMSCSVIICALCMCSVLFCIYVRSVFVHV